MVSVRREKFEELFSSLGGEEKGVSVISIPTGVDVAVKKAFNQEPNTPIIGKPMQKGSRWSELVSLAEELANVIVTTTKANMETVKAISDSGCVSRPEELIRTVKTAENDMVRFSEELDQIYSSHAHRTGVVSDPKEHVEYLATYEKYIKLNSFLLGSIQHTTISMTEFMLEAKDIAREREREHKAAFKTDSPDQKEQA